MMRYITLCWMLAGLSLATVCEAQATSPSSAGAHTLLLVQLKQGAYTVIGRRDIATPIPRAKMRTSDQGWSFQALDASGGVVYTGSISDPRVIRGDFRNDATGATTGVQVIETGTVTFAIRVPAGSKTLVLYGTPTPAASGSTEAGGPLARITL
jgi:hypothetical protein